MSKGLELILRKVDENPSQRLISRYLSLIAEIPDKVEKTTRALDLAEVLITKKQDEAIRIAHMVYKEDESNVRALEILMDSFKAKGRLAKAEVLRLELEKMNEDQERSQAQQEPASTDDLLSQDEPAKDFHLPKPPDQELSYSDLVSHNPNNTFLPLESLRGAAFPELAGLSIDLDLDKAPDKKKEADIAPEVHKVQAPKPPERLPYQDYQRPLPQEDNTAFEQRSRKSRRRSAPPPPVAQSRLDAAIELFDHYWHQGYVAEAREVLVQLAPFAGQQPWWLARSELLQQVGSAVDALKLFPPEAKEAESHNDPLPPAPPPPVSLVPHTEELSAEPLPSPVASAELPSAPLLPEVPLWRTMLEEAQEGEGLAESLRTAVFVQVKADIEELQRSSGEYDTVRHDAALLDLVWDVASALWEKSLSAEVIILLEDLGMHLAQANFFALYLDALLHQKRARRALAVIRRTITLATPLDWVSLAAARLPAIWQGLGLRGFVWREEDGAAAFCERLAERPAARLSSLPVTRY